MTRRQRPAALVDDLDLDIVDRTAHGFGKCDLRRGVGARHIARLVGGIADHQMRGDPAPDFAAQCFRGGHRAEHEVAQAGKPRHVAVELAQHVAGERRGHREVGDVLAVDHRADLGKPDRQRHQVHRAAAIESLQGIAEAEIELQRGQRQEPAGGAGDPLAAGLPGRSQQMARLPARGSLISALSPCGKSVRETTQKSGSVAITARRFALPLARTRLNSPLLLLRPRRSRLPGRSAVPGPGGRRADRWSASAATVPRGGQARKRRPG